MAEDYCTVLVSLTQLQLEELSFGWALNEGSLELETSTHIAFCELFIAFYILEDNYL